MDYFLRIIAHKFNHDIFVNNHNVMNKNIDFDKVLGIANNMVGTLDLLASLYATAAANDQQGGEARSLAGTFALLHANAASMAELLMDG